MLLLEVDPTLCSAKWIEETVKVPVSFFLIFTACLKFLQSNGFINSLKRLRMEFTGGIDTKTMQYKQLVLFDIDSTILIGSQTHKEAFHYR